MVGKDTGRWLLSYSYTMKWYSYSKTADFDKSRSIAHRCVVDCGGFEYEYCFAEYEYRVAEYDTNRRNQTFAAVGCFRTRTQ